MSTHRESALGLRLPVYDGRKSLYTAGPLPFQSREFHINLLDEDDGTSTQRSVDTIIIFGVFWLQLCNLTGYYAGEKERSRLCSS